MDWHNWRLSRRQLTTLTGMLTIESVGLVLMDQGKDFSFLFGWFAGCGWLLTRRLRKHSFNRYLALGITAVTVSEITRRWLLAIPHVQCIALFLAFIPLIIIELDNAGIANQRQGLA